MSRPSVVLAVTSLGSLRLSFKGLSLEAIAITHIAKEAPTMRPRNSVMEFTSVEALRSSVKMANKKGFLLTSSFVHEGVIVAIFTQVAEEEK